MANGTAGRIVANPKAFKAKKEGKQVSQLAIQLRAKTKRTMRSTNNPPAKKSLKKTSSVCDEFEESATRDAGRDDSAVSNYSAGFHGLCLRKKSKKRELICSSDSLERVVAKPHRANRHKRARNSEYHPTSSSTVHQLLPAARQNLATIKAEEDSQPNNNH